MRSVLKICLAAALILAVTNLANANVLEVRAPSGGVRALGDVYTTIQAAIDDAEPGDTITIHHGTYDEQLIITKSLTLQGEGDNTVIRPSGIGKLTPFTNPSNFSNYSAGYNGKTLYSIIVVSNVGVAGVTIKDLKVDGVNITSLPGGVENGTDWIEGIKYSDSAGLIQNVTVANLRTTGGVVRTYGIDASAGSSPVSVEIAGCRISNWQRNAIVAYGGSNNLTVNVHGNILTGPGTIGPDNVPNGVVLITDVGGTISGNTIHGCHYSVPLSWRSVGIMMFDICPSGVVIENNEVYDVDDGVNVSNDAIVRNNNLHGNGAGVVLEYSSAYNQSIVHNTITNNTNGIQINGVLNPNPEGLDPPGLNNVAHNNCIVGNTYGVRSFDNTQVFNAELNFWGNPTGPYHPVYNPGGLGDKISDYISFYPWLIACDSNTPGYKPVHNVTLGAYYDKIQPAIDAARNGDLITADAGTYVEAVNITKSVTLQGAAGAVIKPDNTTPLLDGGVRRAALYINGVDGVNISGFEIDGTGGDVHIGIYGLNSDNSTIKNNVVHDIKNVIEAPVSDVAGVGIMFFGWGQGIDGAHIEDNTVYNTGRMGIWTGGMNSSTYNFLITSGNVIKNNTVYNAWQGPTNDGGGAIQINGAKDSSYEGNKVYNTGNNWFGIYYCGSSTGNTITGNDVYNNKYGIVIWSNVSFVEYGGNAAGAPVAHCNKIHGNTTLGLRNVDTDPAYKVNAENNWWGDASGPGGAGGGSGDKVSANVDFFPWLLSEQCDNPAQVAADFVVDDNWAGLPDWTTVVVDGTNYFIGLNAFDTIQEAVNAASDGNNVRVLAGTYVEQVEITKRLTIRGAGQGSTVIQSPNTLPLYFTTSGKNYAVVYLHDVCGAVIKDLTVDGAGKGNANYRFLGIGLFNAGATIDNVGIINVKDTPLSGAQHGVALYAYDTSGSVCNVDVLNCTINSFQKTAIAISGAKAIGRVENCTITGAGDTPVTAQNGIQIGFGASGTIKGNNVGGIRYTGGPNWSASAILGYGSGGSETISIEDNTISSSQGAIQVYYFNGGTSVLNNTVADSNFSYLLAFDKGNVSGNDFGNSSEQGLYLADVTNIKGAGNSFDGCVIGLVVDGASDGVAFANCQFTNNSEAGAMITPYEGSHPKNISINNSNFGGSGFGVENDSNNVVDASYNWWGNANGPADPCGTNETDGKKCYDVATVMNADGLGDKVSDGNVIYCPWLAAPMITSLDGQCPLGDLDGDCDVDFNDLAILAQNWLVGT